MGSPGTSAVCEPARAVGGARVWVHDPAGLAALGGEAALCELFRWTPPAWLRRVEGRETFLSPAGGHVVKRQRGLDRREWWHEILHRGRVRPAGRIEADNLRALREAGFAVPRPIAAAARGGLSLVVMERVGHATDLASALAASAGPAARSAWLDELASFVARLHAAGFYHRDLYLQHFVLPRGRDGLVLLDCGRARRARRPRERWFVKDLAALAHSLPANVGAAEWHAWVACYRERRGAGPQIASLLAAIDAKRAQLAAHAPRRVDPQGGRRSEA